jgi:hypothetical protein
MTAALENASLQTPLFITALKCVVSDKLPDVYVPFVLGISVQVSKPGPMENCHFIILPVSPLKVSIPELLPEQIVVLPLTDPPTEAGSTVTVVDVELSRAHAPL